MLRDDLQETYNNMLKLLERQRDEISLKVHLGSMEAKSEWNDLEKKLEGFKAKGNLLRKEAEDSAHELEETLELLGDEIKEGYERIKNLLK